MKKGRETVKAIGTKATHQFDEKRKNKPIKPKIKDVKK